MAAGGQWEMATRARAGAEKSTMGAAIAVDRRAVILKEHHSRHRAPAPDQGQHLVMTSIPPAVLASAPPGEAYCVRTDITQARRLARSAPDPQAGIARMRPASIADASNRTEAAAIAHRDGIA